MTPLRAPTLTVCCLCGAWRTDEEAFAPSPAPSLEAVRVSHTYCPACARRIISRIHRIRRDWDDPSRAAPRVHRDS